MPRGSIGARPHDVDRCLWVFKNSAGTVIGRAHVDDFLIAGNHNDPEWMKIREKIKRMYAWSPWKTGSFTFAGLEIRQMKNYEIRVTQEAYCNSLEPIEIANDKSRSGTDPLLPREVSQFRGLTMKAQWRAVQTAFQYCAKVGIQASSVNKATVQHVRDANNLLKELKKTAKDSFNHGWRNSSSGTALWAYNSGMLATITVPVAARRAATSPASRRPRSSTARRPRSASWTGGLGNWTGRQREPMERKARPSTRAEDKGWKCRIFWVLMYGKELTRSNAKDLACLMVTDSRGLYDAITSSDSPMLGMNNSRTGIEATAVQKGLREDGKCYLTWVPSDMNLADSLTKATGEAFKVAALYHARKAWVVRFNQEFVSARKQQRLRKAKEQQEAASMAVWPAEDFEDELRGLSTPADR